MAAARTLAVPRAAVPARASSETRMALAAPMARAPRVPCPPAAGAIETAGTPPPPALPARWGGPRRARRAPPPRGRPPPPPRRAAPGRVSSARSPRQCFWDVIERRPRPLRPAARIGSLVHGWIEREAAGQGSLLEAEAEP